MSRYSFAENLSINSYSTQWSPRTLQWSMGYWTDWTLITSSKTFTYFLLSQCTSGFLVYQFLQRAQHFSLLVTFAHMVHLLGCFYLYLSHSCLSSVKLFPEYSNCSLLVDILGSLPGSARAIGFLRGVCGFSQLF